MEIINIKNDIKLRIYITSNDSTFFDSVRMVKCHIRNSEMINKRYTDCDCFHCCDHCRRCTKYATHFCGKHVYNVLPHEECCYNQFRRNFHHGLGHCCHEWTYNDPHWWPAYNGFGVISKKFEGPCCHCHYETPCVVDREQDHVDAYFPAHEQHCTGKYSVLLEIFSYEPGWGKDNLHVRTVDLGEVFQLVDVDEETEPFNGVVELTANVQVTDDLELDGISDMNKDRLYFGVDSFPMSFHQIYENRNPNNHITLRLNDSGVYKVKPKGYLSSIGKTKFWVAAPYNFDIRLVGNSGDSLFDGQVDEPDSYETDVIVEDMGNYKLYKLDRVKPMTIDLMIICNRKKYE